jgi:hypothetical protein
LSKFLSELWHQIKTRGSIVVLPFFETSWSFIVLLGESQDKLWHKMKAAGENIGLMFLVPGFFVLIAMFIISLVDEQIEVIVFATVLSLGLGFTSVGVGFIAVGMSAKSDKRQTELLERLDKNVAGLPLLFKGDILTPSGHKAVKELRGKQSKVAAQKRLDEDTRKVGYVRGELFKNEDGSWSIHWGGKYPL